MNWGILSLLGIIVFVLGAVAAFFIFLARRASRLAEPLPVDFMASSGKFKPELAAVDNSMSFRGQTAVPALARRRRACAPRRSRKTRPGIPASRP